MAIGSSEVTYYRWRRECGGLTASQAKCLEDSERKAARRRSTISR
ncbi:MAG TPA: hypothetical protein VIK32_01315 [Candidatus Limnocylindrales bacterium]